MKILLSLSLFICLPAILLSQELFVQHDLTQEKQFTTNCEGPAVDAQGNLYAVNYNHDGSIAIIAPGKEVALYLDLPAGSVGNGIRFNKAGFMFVADFRGHNLLMVNPADKKVSVFAHSDQFNQPNDLAISNSGIIFLSDPNWQDGTGKIWKVMPDGTLKLLEEGMGTTNGIEVSPDDKHLYVNESIQQRIWQYDLDEDGNISNKKLFAQFNDFGLDGMRCDCKGNLYVTRYDKGCVAIFSASGMLIREVQMKGKKTSNVSFGGPDGKTVFVTLQDRGCIEWFLNDEKGAR